MKNIIISIPNEKDLTFFDEVVKEYPKDISVLKKRGFDTVALSQIVVDASVAMIPHFLTALGLFLTYKIEQKKINQKENELNLERQKEEQTKTEKFEIKINAGSHKIIYSNVNLNEDNINIDEILKNIVSAFGADTKDE